MTKKFLLLALAAVVSFGAAAKKPLDHDAFDSWKSVRVAPLSNNGLWAAYMVNPQEGDGMLTLRNTKRARR